jgi:hypothetical protein
MRNTRVRRRIAWLASVSLAASGCATTPEPPSPELRSRLGQIAVAADPAAPAGNFLTFAKGRLEGSVVGGAGGALAGLAEGVSQGLAGGGGPYGGAAIALAAIVFTLVGGTIGAVAGHQAAVPADTAEQIDREVAEALGRMELSRAVAEGIRERARADASIASHGFTEADHGMEHPDLAARGVDTLIQISVPEAGFIGGSGRRPSIAFYMSARVRLSDTATGEAQYVREFLYTSAPHPFNQWFGDQASRFVEEFGVATDALSGRILEELFLVTDFPFPSGKWALGGPEFATCWFYPVHPARDMRSLWEFMAHPGALDPERDLLGYPLVESLQPTLEWEPLPRPRDQVPEHEVLLARIENVSYDLRIWEARDGHPEQLVYDRVGLREPRHRLEYTLAPATQYFWSFRARYSLDGKPQATRWAFSLAPGGSSGNACDLDAIPPANYYRFATPAGGD